MSGVSFITPTLLRPAQIKPKSEEKKTTSFFFTRGGRASCLRACLDAVSSTVSLVPHLSEGADSVAGQLRGDNECLFGGVVSCGTVGDRGRRAWERGPAHASCGKHGGGGGGGERGGVMGVPWGVMGMPMEVSWGLPWGAMGVCHGGGVSWGCHGRYVMGVSWGFMGVPWGYVMGVRCHGGCHGVSWGWGVPWGLCHGGVMVCHGGVMGLCHGGHGVRGWRGDGAFVTPLSVSVCLSVCLSLTRNPVGQKPQ